jgi:lysine 6-dehydrogenase
MDLPVYTKKADGCQDCGLEFPGMKLRYISEGYSREKLICGKCFSKTGKDVIDHMVRMGVLEIIEDWRETKNVTILGAGNIGIACAVDLSKRYDIENIYICDSDIEKAELVYEIIGSSKIVPKEVDVTSGDSIPLGTDLTISCVPYRFNYELAKEAIGKKSHFLDLGGNNSIVDMELGLNKEAQDAGILIVPDCGLAPGLVSVFAKSFSEKLLDVTDMKFMVGGLPRDNSGDDILNYALSFSVTGLLNEYLENAVVIKHGKIQEVSALDNLTDEIIDGHKLESFSTSGGISTLPSKFLGKLNSLEYKTLRWRGHHKIISSMEKMGLMSSNVDHGMTNSPREILEARFSEYFPQLSSDIVFFKAEAASPTGSITLSIKDLNDSRSGLSAMQRMTAFPTTALAELILDGTIPDTGAKTQENFVPCDILIKKISNKGISINEDLS